MKKAKADKKCSDKEIIVKISLPEHLPQAVKQIKINRLYDILKPKTEISE